MFDDLRKQAYKDFAIKSSGNIAFIVDDNEVKNNKNLMKSLDEQKQTMYDYLRQSSFLDLLEKEITQQKKSQKVDVNIDTEDLERQLNDALANLF